MVGVKTRVSAKAGFLEELSALGDVDAITLRVNSSKAATCLDGVAIHNALKNTRLDCPPRTSMASRRRLASFIVMAANSIVMPSNSFIADVTARCGMSWGNADDMRATADDLDRIDKSLTATYASRSKMSNAKVKALMKEDRLMDAEEAKSLGFADIVTEPVKMAANYSMRLLPKAVAERIRAETGEMYSEEPSPAANDQQKSGDQPVDPRGFAPCAREDDTRAALAIRRRTTIRDPHEGKPEPAKAPDPAAKSAQVITLDAAKKEGIEEHRQYVASVTDLCTLARAPERVGAYVRASTPVEQVAQESCARWPRCDRRTSVMSQHADGLRAISSYRHRVRGARSPTRSTRGGRSTKQLKQKKYF